MIRGTKASIELILMILKYTYLTYFSDVVLLQLWMRCGHYLILCDCGSLFQSLITLKKTMKSPYLLMFGSTKLNWFDLVLYP